MDTMEIVLIAAALLGGIFVYKAFNSKARFAYDPETGTYLDRNTNQVHKALTPSPLPDWVLQRIGELVT